MKTWAIQYYTPHISPQSQLLHHKSALHHAVNILVWILETPPSTPLLLRCSAVLHCMFDTHNVPVPTQEKLASWILYIIHKMMLPVQRLETDHMADPVTMSLPVCKQQDPCSNKIFIQALQHSHMHTIANLCPWHCAILYGYVNFWIYHSLQIHIYPKYIFGGGNLSSSPNFRWLPSVLGYASKAHPVLR